MWLKNEVDDEALSIYWDDDDRLYDKYVRHAQY